MDTDIWSYVYVLVVDLSASLVSIVYVCLLVKIKIADAQSAVFDLFFS